MCELQSLRMGRSQFFHFQTVELDAASLVVLQLTTIQAGFTQHGSSDPLQIFFPLSGGTDLICASTCKQEKKT